MGKSLMDFIYSMIRQLVGLVLCLIWFSLWNGPLRVFLQVGTLREIQRLYDELVASANACRLDRYSASEKSGR